MINLEDLDAEIAYPLKWTYKVIGMDSAAISAAVESCINRDYTFNFSNVSSGGKYQSFKVEVWVENEKERLDFFNQLAAHPDIMRII